MDEISNIESLEELDSTLSRGLALLIELKHKVDQNKSFLNRDEDMIKTNRLHDEELNLNESKIYKSHSELSVHKNENYIFVFENEIDLKRSKKRGRKASTSKRVCNICNVTETPEWRKGPDGKSILCNACGLKFSKKRREKKKGLSKASIQLIID